MWRIAVKLFTGIDVLTCSIFTIYVDGHSLDVGFNKVGQVLWVDGFDVFRVNLQQVVVARFLQEEREKVN